MGTSAALFVCSQFACGNDKRHPKSPNTLLRSTDVFVIAVGELRRHGGTSLIALQFAYGDDKGLRVV
jgi:hypothetical protein